MVIGIRKWLSQVEVEMDGKRGVKELSQII